MNRIVLIPLALLSLLAACTGNNGTNGTNGRTTLVLLVTEPPGVHCASGGVAIEEGIDTNGNGILDDSEVNAAATQYVCNGNNGSSGAQGDAGPQGGAGDAGPSGYNALVNVTAEPPGANCEFGGERIDTGLDLNRDGILEAGEITSTTYVCEQSSLAGYYFGDIHITQAADLALLDGIKVIVGSLYFDAPFGSALSLPDLQQVSGIVDMEVGLGGNGRSLGTSPDLVGLLSVSFPALTQASDIYIIGQEDLTSISFPALAAVNTIDFENNQKVTSIDFSSLARAASHFVVYGETALTSLPLPMLANAPSLDLGQNDALTSLSFPALAQTPGELSIHENGALASITLGALVSANWIEIDDNGSLTTLSAPLLRAVPSTLSINSNASLDTCAIYRLILQLTTVPATTNLNNNSSVGTCSTADLCVAVPIAGISGTVSWCAPQAPWATGEQRCESLGTGGHLLWLESQAELTALAAAEVAGNLPGNVWIGYSDDTSEGTWYAISGFNAYDPAMPITNNPSWWSAGEPNGGTGENCDMLYSTGLNNDASCTSSFRPICRVPAAAARK